MGYMRHHAIVVTSWQDDLLDQAHTKAVELNMSVSNITGSATNGHRSFLVAPDGSKEGWDESNVGDEQRATLIEWLDAQRYDDDSTTLDWVEVQFADEELDSHIVRDSDDHRRRRRARRNEPFTAGQTVRILVGPERLGQTATVGWIQHDGQVVVYFGDQDEDEWVYGSEELEHV